MSWHKEDYFNFVKTYWLEIAAVAALLAVFAIGYHLGHT